MKMKFRISILSFFILVIAHSNIYSQEKDYSFSDKLRVALWTGIFFHLDLVSDVSSPSNSLKSNLQESDLSWSTVCYSGAIGFRVNRFGFRIEGLSGDSGDEYNYTSSGANYTGPIDKEKRHYSMFLGSLDLLNINKLRCTIFGGKGAFKSEIMNKIKDHSTTIKQEDYAYGYELSYDIWMKIEGTATDSIPTWKGPTFVQECYLIDSNPSLVRIMFSIGYSQGAGNLLKYSLFGGASIYKISHQFTSVGFFVSIRFNR